MQGKPAEVIKNANNVSDCTNVQWAAHQPTTMCQNFTVELEPQRIVTYLEIDQINMTGVG